MRLLFSENVISVVNSLDPAKQKYLKSIDSGLSEAAGVIASKQRVAAPKARTLLAQSILPKRVAPASYEVTTGVNYARYVEYGRKPGRMPSVRAIDDWRRIVNPKLNPYRVALKIAREGIKPKPFFFKTAQTVDINSILLRHVKSIK